MRVITHISIKVDRRENYQLIHNMHSK